MNLIKLATMSVAKERLLLIWTHFNMEAVFILLIQSKSQINQKRFATFTNQIRSNPSTESLAYLILKKCHL